MDLATKRVAYLWTALALVAEAMLVARGWPAVLPAALGAAALAAAAATIDRRAIALVLVFTYLTPTVIRAVHGDVHPFFSVIWFAALFGGLVPSGARTGWRIPRPWRAPLVLWILVVIVATPIVIARELDFNTVLLARDPIPGSSLGSLPSFTASWILHVGLTQVLGILWFDWLFGHGDGVAADVAAPLAISAAGLMIVAAYQAFGDMTFLNETTFGVTGRATGTMFDANLCGAIAAMWIGLSAVPAFLSPRWPRWMSAGGVLLGWLTVLASGSRTAQLAAVLVSAFVLMAIVARHGRATARMAATVVLPATAVLVGVLLVLGWAGVGPVGRLWQSLPDASTDGWREFALEMWNRNGYGRASAAMIRDFPMFGVGLGSFQTLLPLFAPGLIPDNAQNWYRQILAEYGVVGALGPLAWSVLFARFVLWPPVTSAAGWPLRGVVIAFGAIALVGMPGQDLAVALTFWTAAFWFASLSGRAAGAGSEAGAISRGGWGVIAVVIVIFGAGTARLAVGDLRAPVRSERIDWPYSYGFYWPERDANGGEYRWTRARAVTVLEAPQRTMALTMAVPHGDIREHPVTIEAWADGRQVLNRTVDSGAPVTVDVQIPHGRPRVRLETRASRAVVPAETGAADDRELAATVAWRFTGDPNPWATPPRDELGRYLTVSALTPDVPLPSPAGMPITWAASASGGAAPYSYKFWVSDGTTTWMARDWDTSSSWTWDPLPGSYTIQVWVRNTGSPRASDASLSARASITMPAELTVARVTPSASAITVGAPLTWAATALGGANPISYRFFVFDGSTWELGQEWSTANTWTWTPTAGGTYSFQVWVRNAGSTADNDAWRSFGPIAVPEPSGLTVTTLTPSTPQVMWQTPVTWTASAVGGAGPYTYEFNAYDASGRADGREWGPSNSWTWTPTEVGFVSVEVRARNAASTAAYDAQRSFGPVNVAAPSVLTVASQRTTATFPVTVGTPVTWTAAALGGTGPYTYLFYVFSDGVWTIGRDWSPSNIWTWTPSSAGSYRFQVWVRNAGSDTPYDGWSAAGPVSVVR